MTSHPTVVSLVGAALLSAAAAVAQTPTTPGRAMNGALIEATVPSINVPGPVPITYYLPKIMTRSVQNLIRSSFTVETYVQPRASCSLSVFCCAAASPDGKATVKQSSAMLGPLG